MVFGEKVDVGVAAAKLSNGKKCSTVVLQAKPANTGDIFVGDSVIQPMVLGPGASITLEISDLSEVWVRSTVAAQGVGWGVA